MTVAAYASPLSAPLPPGPKGDPLIGSLRALHGDRLAWFTRVATEYGGVAGLRVGPQRLVFLSSPGAIRHVLQENARNYDKQTRGFDQLRLLLGDGLLTSEGSFWLRQRRLAQPAFHRQRLAGFAGVFASMAGDLAAEWERAADAGTSADVAQGWTRLTLRIASETLFGADVGGETAEISSALALLLRFANDRILAIFRVPEFIPSTENRRMLRARDTLDRVVSGLVERRRREGAAGRHDLLAMLMEARDEETGEQMSDRQLRDEVMTLLLAGHETTANTLAWSSVLLSHHPAVRRKVEAELATVLGGRVPTLEDVPRLVEVRKVIDETMRLFPPAWMFSRRAIAEDLIEGYRIPANAFVLVSPWVTHRLPAHWENPEGFDPERFAPENAAKQDRFAYFPFGGGPRQCIGNNFALLELTLVLAAVAQRVRLDLLPGAAVVPEPTITLRPGGGLVMRPRRAGA